MQAARQLIFLNLRAGSSSAWTIFYEAGELGVDDSGEILIARRDVCDADLPQFSDPSLSGYVKVNIRRGREAGW